MITTTDIKAASLDDPLYYLRNAKQVIKRCLNHYADLLTLEEREALEALLMLPLQARALLMRMVMRKGELFRCDGFNYVEVPAPGEALQRLSVAGWVSLAPPLTLATLCRLLKRPECLALARQLWPQAGWPASMSKALLVTQLAEADDGRAQLLTAWWPQAPVQVVELCRAELFDRLQLMFFGNLRQGWSEFVLTELQHQRFEQVPLLGESRPFHRRAEVDLYLHLANLEHRAAQGESLENICHQLPASVGTDWLDYRRQRVLFRLGREAERQGKTRLSLALYRQSEHRDAQVRSLRLREKNGTTRAGLCPGE